MTRKRKDRVILSELEKQIIQLICAQHTNKEIGVKLEMKMRSIEKKRLLLNKKLGVKNTAGLVIYAIVNKVVKIKSL